jgi:RNA polymerase sigma-70 factor (ECF subfamily)
MTTLVDGIIHGDKHSIVELYHLYSPKISMYLKNRLPRPEDAQEVLNDVFFDAIDSITLLKKKENLSSWLYRIAHNKVVDFYRKKKIKSVLLSQVPFLEIIAQEIHQPEFQFEKNKIKERIEKTLSSLSKQYKEILSLHYEQKVPVKDLALRFNLSFKATESLLFRARMSFKKIYERT